MLEMLLDNLDVIAEAPNGVQKIREMILQLAVRGKLVPEVLSTQAMHELPAADPVVPSQRSSPWQTRRLGELGTWGSGGTPRRSNPAFYGGDIPWLKIGDLTDGPIVRAEECITEAALADSSAKMIPAGTVLVAMYGSIGKLGVTTMPCATNQAIAHCIPDQRLVTPGYLFLVLRSARAELISRGQGGAQSNISQQTLKAVEVQLPPLPEQQPVVATVDELMALCDQLEEHQRRRSALRIRANRSAFHHLTESRNDKEFAAQWTRLRENFQLLYDAPEAVAELRQAVVELAVRGKVVPPSTSERRGNAPPAQIVAARRASARVNGGVSGRAEPPAAADGMPFPLPGSWKWVRFADVVDRIEAGWSPNCYSRPRTGDEWGVLKISAVSWGAFNPDENKALPGGLSPRPEHEVRAGDFLMTRANTAELVGRSVVVSETPPRLLLNDKTLRVYVSDGVDPRYLSLFNNSKVARSYYAQQASGTSSSMRNLSRDQIRRLPVPLPPLDEQHRIVAEVDRLLKLCDVASARLAVAQEKSLFLAASVSRRFQSDGAN